eukprot:1875276-Rhodomonas_salina.1
MSSGAFGTCRNAVAEEMSSDANNMLCCSLRESRTHALCRISNTASFWRCDERGIVEAKEMERICPISSKRNLKTTKSFYLSIV